MSDRAPEATNVLTWCSLCGTEHLLGLICPAQLDATGPEKPRWRVAVETPHGVRGYGVLVAESGARWRSRIVTFPNVLWMVPGGGETLKFMAKTEDDAIRRAVDFIRRHCVSKSYTMRDEVQFVAPLERKMIVVGAPVDRSVPPAPRFDRRLPIHFGRSRPTLLGHTGNLSETGLFVATRTPLGDGELLGLSLELEHCKVPLRGSVAWHRALRNPNLDLGMGLRLFNPPTAYVDYIRALA